jgi:hypothetical protein
VPHICWPGLAHRELSDQLAANQAAERALTLAEPDPLVLSFAMTGSRAPASVTAPWLADHLGVAGSKAAENR